MGAAGQEGAGAGDTPAPGDSPGGQGPSERHPRRDDRRGESGNQRLDRNWQEMLQELRVMQAGIQILAGFLLILPFQRRFEELDDLQVGVYLCLLCLSVLIQALLLSTVTLHRALFGLHVKGTLVEHTAAIIPFATALVGVVLAGTLWLVFDIVLGRTASLVVAGVLLALEAILWVAYPLALRRRALRQRG
ncbi:DUF6328 family protein [Arthrobacter antioxidans]|uniref:DUF6328 family protein n=1 Tax=Arthrobacter antioxidans TaxID=2895818 RepID=UPI001FFEDC12|nr:DUF6328 family protein [Arthrobacter antioxidans]